MHRRTRKILIVVGVIVVALAVGYGIALAQSTMKLAAARVALEQDGRPMVAADLVPPLVSDDENAASFYRYASDVLKQQAVTRKKTLLDHAADLAFSFVGDAFEPDKRAELEALMTQEHVSSALAAFEQGLQRPVCRFDYGYDNGLHADGFESRDLRLLARIRAAQACLEAEAGRAGQAWDMVQAQFRCADALRYTPTVGGHLSRLGIIGDLCRTIRKLYEIAPPDEPTYQKIEALLADHVDVASFVYAVDAERLLRGEWLFTQPRGQLYEALKRDTLFLGGEGSPEVFNRLVFRVIAFRPRFVADHAAYLQMMRNAVQILEGPYVPSDSDVQEAFRDLARRSLLTSQLAPGIVFGKKVHCGVVAKVHVTRAGLALLQYRKMHGTFPPSLDALGLENLIDPFVDQPLHYRTEAEGFVVYSVGEDQKDNGGAPRRPLDTSGRRPKIPEYDLLWRFPRGTDQAGGDGV